MSKRMIPSLAPLSQAQRRVVRCDVLEKHPDETWESWNKRVHEQQMDDVRFRSDRTMIEATPLNKEK